MSDTWIATKLHDATTFQYRRVYGITLDNNGNIYFTTGGEDLYQARKNTEPQILVHIKGVMLWGIVWNGNDKLYICDLWNHKILSYSLDVKSVSTLVGSVNGLEDGNFTTAQCSNPSGITMDRNGDLYITQNHCVRKINLSQKIVRTVAGSHRYGHRDGDADQTKFFNPFGVVASDDDTIYVADRDNHCIRRIKEGVVLTIAGTPHKQGYQDGPMSHSQFSKPTAIVMDVDGNLLVGDNNGLRKVDLNQQIVSTLQGVPLVAIHSLALSNQHELFACGEECIMKVRKNTWKWKRWIWIGNMKENPNDCLLASLPRDIIKEINQFI